MFKTLKPVAVSLVFLIAMLTLVSPAAAHRMLVERQGDYFLVRYDDNTPAQGAQVTFFDSESQVLFTDIADGSGRVNVPQTKFARLQADDGLGHRAFYEPGQIDRTIPRPIAAALGVSFFLFAASLGNYLNKKRAAKEQQAS